MTIRVQDFAQACEAIDGKHYTLDGISGHIKVERPRPFETRINHEPDARGKRTKAYQKLKAECHDDWSTDLTRSERLGLIMWELGIRFPNEED